MREERRAILSLVAMGRISAAEAERLIAAWSADREVLWLAAGAAALMAAQGLFHGPAAGHLAQALSPGWHWIVDHVIAQWGKGLGGLI